MKKYQVGEFIMGSYPIEIWQSRFLVPVGCALALVLMVLKLSRTVVRLFRPDLDEPDEDDRGPDADDPVAGTNI